MRIAMVAPLEISVPPFGYGGTELVASLLTEELVRRGHEVTLFASGDSRTSARLVSGSPRFLRGTRMSKAVYEALNVVACLEHAERFDIIHNHTLIDGMAMACLARTPMLTTLHGPLDGDFRLLFERYRGWYNAISYSAQSLLPPKERSAGVIYNAIDCNSYPVNGRPRDDFLLYLSRISPEKGTHLAIQVAKRLNRKLVIAGNVDAADQPYFEREVLPGVDGELIEYVGEANAAMKRDLLTRARCLLAPITWNEPFGLFLVEAMACGTPVVVFNRGSAPEVVRDGVTGYVVDTLEQMVDATTRVDRIDPAACRAHVERNFDVPRMVDDYLTAYRFVIAGNGPRGRRRRRRTDAPPVLLRSVQPPPGAGRARPDEAATPAQVAE